MNGVRQCHDNIEVRNKLRRKIFIGQLANTGIPGKQELKWCYVKFNYDYFIK